MTALKSLLQMSDQERAAAEQKYKMIAPFLNKTSSLKKISEKSGVPIRTLNLWLKKYREGGLKGLARKTRDDKGIFKIYDEELQKRIEGIYFKNPELSSASIHKLISEYCEQSALKVPSYKTVYKIVNSIPDDMSVLATQGSKAYQQKYDLLHLRSSNRPNEIWQADHVLIDIEIYNDKSELERPWLTIIIDDCSRAICGYELSFLAPSSNKTSLCLRHALWRKVDPRWSIMGVPETLYTDHGSDFTSKQIEQVCIDLKINLIHSQIGRPRGRGKIERFFRTLISRINSITTTSNKQPHFDLKSMDKIVYDFIIDYNHQSHSDLGMSPTERWQLNGFLPQTLDSLEDLDLLLFTVEKPRRILRDGIHFQGVRYIDLILAEYIGENVSIRYNPSDISSIRVFYKQKFLCQPICTELSQSKISLKEIQSVLNKRR
ncbi:MAG: DDE-type integrase/transposase/recombinase [Halobacteriovoraceae bacterium]|nr:DDE-type integrase/transposase/recombinase [Halobacteriovoraceae bacterium]